jgi:hypothetical protein
MPRGTGPELREERQWLAQQGFSWSFIQNNRDKVTWYKPDGTALPNLPADPYHMRRYRARGWTLVAPDSLVIPQDAVDQLQEQVAAAAELLDIGDEGATEVAPHQHTFNRAMGSPCRTEGCTTVRTREYKPRAK